MFPCTDEETSPSRGPLLQPGVPYEMQTMDVGSLAMLLGRSARSIKNDVSRNPLSLPPIFRPPGTQKVMFKVKEVVEWMEELAEAENKRRRALQAAAGRSGIAIERYRQRDILRRSKRVLPQSQRESAQ